MLFVAEYSQYYVFNSSFILLPHETYYALWIWENTKCRHSPYHASRHLYTAEGMRYPPLSPDSRKRKYIGLIRHSTDSAASLNLNHILHGKKSAPAQKVHGWVEQHISVESFTATNVAALCRRHRVSIALFHRWKEHFLEGERKKPCYCQMEKDTRRK